MIKYKNNTNSKLVFKMKFISNKDYNALSPIDAITYDKRGFLQLFWMFLKSDNALLNLFFHHSIMEPLWIKLILFFFNLTLTFFASALFYSDDYIDQKAELSEGERVSFILIELKIEFCVLYNSE